MQLWQAYPIGDGGGKRSRRDVHSQPVQFVEEFENLFFIFIFIIVVYCP